MALSGFSGPGFDRTKELLDHFPIDPMRGGGTCDPQGGPTRDFATEQLEVGGLSVLRVETRAGHGAADQQQIEGGLEFDR